MLASICSAYCGRVGTVRIGDAESVGEAPGEVADGSGYGGVWRLPCRRKSPWSISNDARVFHARRDGIGQGCGASDDEVGKVQAKLKKNRLLP